MLNMPILQIMKIKTLKFTKEELIECVKFLIDNSFIISNGNIYKQVIGIPMGSNAGPHIANIYLHQYEHKYFTYLYENNSLLELKRMQHIFRYQDDLLSLNDLGYLEEVISRIYSPEMIVSKTNISIAKTTFLDLSISIYRGKFLIKLYDKRRDYNFEVISFPFLDGNKPKGPSYGIFISQLVRYAHINNTYRGFIANAKDLVCKLSHQHFDVAALSNKFRVFVDIWGKYGKNIDEDLIFS